MEEKPPADNGISIPSSEAMGVPGLISSTSSSVNEWRFVPPWKWLESTARFQEDVYGYAITDWREQPDYYTEAIAKYIQWNTFAIYNELAELAYEFSWKPWASDKPFVRRERITGEAIDVLHFIGNILTALGVTDDEFWSLYQFKQDKNRERAKSGTYSAQKGGVGVGSDV